MYSAFIMAICLVLQAFFLPTFAFAVTEYVTVVKILQNYQFPGEKRLLLELIDEGLAIEESRHVNVQDLIGMNSL